MFFSKEIHLMFHAHKLYITKPYFSKQMLLEVCAVNNYKHMCNHTQHRPVQYRRTVVVHLYIESQCVVPQKFNLLPFLYFSFVRVISFQCYKQEVPFLWYVLGHNYCHLTIIAVIHLKKNCLCSDITYHDSQLWICPSLCMSVCLFKVPKSTVWNKK